MPLISNVFEESLKGDSKDFQKILFLLRMRYLLTSAETREVGFWFGHRRKFACQLKHILATFIQPPH